MESVFTPDGPRPDKAENDGLKSTVQNQQAQIDVLTKKVNAIEAGK